MKEEHVLHKLERENKQITNVSVRYKPLQEGI